MAVKFGTSGLRGLSTQLVGSVSALYATAFARFLVESNHLPAGGVVAVARDFRESSPEIAATVMAAIRRVGLVPVDCGWIPTPALALYAQKIGAAAIMVTGSHIPADRNGIKFYRPDGEIDKDDEATITRLAAELANDQTANSVEKGTGENQEAEATALFVDRNLSILPADALKSLRIGVYEHSSVARDMMTSVFKQYGATVVSLGRSETFIPVDTEAVSAETEALLRKWSAEHKLDAIVSTDGDGDRPLVADEAGRPLRGDLLGLVAARYLHATTVVTPVTSNSGIESIGGFEVIRTRVGSPFVIAAMNGALARGDKGVVGFEANGGTMLGSAFDIDGRDIAALPTRDSFLPALAVLGSAVANGWSLSQLSGSYNLPVALSDRIENFAVERSTSLMKHLRHSSDGLSDFLAPIGKVRSSTDIDGLRVTLDDGRVIHFRPSGNAPEMRCYVEAQAAESAQELLRQGLDAIRSWQSTT